MIHLFESLGKRMALDVGSGAVLSLDPIAYDALKLLVADICQRNNIPLDREHVIGHQEFSPKKTDPGELFDWSRILP